MSFPAKFTGKCSVCARTVSMGDLVDYDPSTRTVSHEECTPEDKKQKFTPKRSGVIVPRVGGMGYRGSTQDERPRKSPLASNPSYANTTIGGNGPKTIAMSFNVHNAEQMGRVLTNKEFFIGSPEQDAIWEAMLHGTENIIVNAAAGSGKTTTAQQGLLRMMRDMDASARSCTYHSLGYGICRKNFPALARSKPNQYKLRNIIDEIERPLSINEDDWYSFSRALGELVKFSKIYLLDGTERERLEEIADFFGVEVNDKHADLVYEFVPKVIRKCLDMTNEVDYQDMIFFPAMMDLKGDTYDLLIADECQDVSPDQRKLFQLACPNGRIMGIGDSWQSLYSWRGAGTDSMERLREMLADSPRSVVEYPLTVTRRCPKSHVRLAQAISGESVIQAMPEASEGVIRIVEEQRAISEMRAGDLVLCRVNRHLVPVAYDLIRRGVKAVVRGRDIGQGLESLIKRLTKDDPNGSTEYLLTQLRMWSANETRKLRAMGERAAGRIQSLEDNVETVIALTDGVDTIPAVLTRIEQLFKDFDDDGKPLSAVVLGTIHRTKGLQSDRVFVLKPELLPHPMCGPNFYKGELCAIYVAVTRAKWSQEKDGELIFCGPVPEPIIDAMPHVAAVVDEDYAAEIEDATI